MKDFRLRTDLKRVTLGDFALPLGIAPEPGHLSPPMQGYTVAFVPGQDDDPDTYSFHIVVTHEKIAPILRRAFAILPPEVFAIIEIGSRDAYRSTDTYISREPIARDEFLRVWNRYEAFLLEDSAIAAGANSEEPFFEVFVDQWKGIAIHAPPSMREDVETMIQEFGLEEVVQTWPDPDDSELGHDEDDDRSHIRSVLDLSDASAPDVDELLLTLRHEWRLELNIDPDANVDEGGRDLGSTLWHAVVIVDRTDHTAIESRNGGGGQGGYASIWATAPSLSEMEQLIFNALDGNPDWSFGEIYTIDRVAFDERPDELADLLPRRNEPQVHLVHIEPWEHDGKPAA